MYTCFCALVIDFCELTPDQDADMAYPFTFRFPTIPPVTCHGL